MNTTLENIAQELAEVKAMIAVPRVTSAILTTPEARVYVKRKSNGGFAAWCARFGVKSVDHGRWSKSHLDLALAREAGVVRVPASLKRRAA